jgi:DNA-binding transcriptional MerR regulator
VPLSDLDDEDFPAFTTGRAAELLGVQQAFLRSLDSADVLVPHRSEGGHRRYSRRQLGVAQRYRELFDDGHPLASAAVIVRLEDALATANAEVTALRAQLDAN